jgi:hypothetical protein
MDDTKFIQAARPCHRKIVPVLSFISFFLSLLCTQYHNTAQDAAMRPELSRALFPEWMSRQERRGREQNKLHPK